MSNVDNAVNNTSVKDSESQVLLKATDDDGENKGGITTISLINGDDVRLKGNWFDEISEIFAQAEDENAFILISTDKYKRKIFVKHIVSYVFAAGAFHTLGETVKNPTVSSKDGF